MTAAVTAAPTPRSSRFRMTRAAACNSDYECDGVEVGERAAYIEIDGVVVVMCEDCADRTEAAAELAAAAPVEIGGPVLPPATVAEAIGRLRDEHEINHQYPDDTVAALLDLLDTAAEDIAGLERERWVWRLRRMARRTSALAPETRAGLHTAASLIERNRETLT